MTRHAARIDANQPSIVAGLRAAGYSVEIIGLPLDLLIHWGGTGGPTGKMALLEIKVEGGKRTEYQKKFFARCRGPAGEAKTLDEAIKFLESI